MKRIITLVAALIMTASLWAQSPEKMSYQAVVRNSGNALVATQAVGMQISILQGGPIGTAVYVETQNPTTNANGLVSLEIGTGTLVSGDFNTINWANGAYFIKIETDPTGGTSYTITGTSQLMSVPYALYAKTSGNGAGPQGPVGHAGADGIDGQDGAVGAQGPAGSSMIPYEPWNMNILDQTLPISSQQTFFIHFIAPFSGVYTKAKMLTSPTSTNSTPINYLGMAIYSNTPYTTAIGGTPTNGRPDAPVTQGSIQGLSLTTPNLFLDVTLAPAFSLTEGESYWFAFAWDKNGPGSSVNIFADYSAYNTAANCILKANGLYSGAGPFGTVVSPNLQQADESVWFRLE